LRYNYNSDPFNYEYFPSRLDYVYNNNPYNVGIRYVVCIYIYIYVTICIAKSNSQYGHCAMLLRVLRSEKDRSAGCGLYDGGWWKGCGRLAKKHCGQYIIIIMFKMKSHISILYGIIVHRIIIRARRLRTNRLFNVVRTRIDNG